MKKSTHHRYELAKVLAVEQNRTGTVRPKCDVVIFARLEDEMAALRQYPRPVHSARTNTDKLHYGSLT